MEIKLLVLRTSGMQNLADFYSLLDLTFEYHKHGKSPYHYSAKIGFAILEIYPLAKNQTETDSNLRLGFSLNDFDKTIKLLKENRIEFVSEPIETDFGFMAVISDPDGRKIELYKQ